MNHLHSSLLVLAGLLTVCVGAAPVAAAVDPYVPGTTTRAEAEANWTKTGASITASGHLALGTGSGMDGMSEAYDEKVELVDVSGVDFEGIGEARFGFYEGTLYLVQAELKRVPFLGMKPAPYTQAELEELKKLLRERHGPPAESRRTLFAKGKKPDEFVWRVGESRLILTTAFMGPVLRMVNKRIEAQIEAERKSTCRKFNTKERIICW